MIARKDVIVNIDGFDEDFFLYGEDQDLCLRVRKLWLEVGYIDSAVVIHHEGQSETSSPKFDIWQRKARAEFIFYKKHYSLQVFERIKRAERIKILWRLATLKMNFQCLLVAPADYDIPILVLH